MKRLTIALLLFIIASNGFSQRIDRDFFFFRKEIKRNEFKVNLPTTIFALYPEVSYERILDSDISVGGTVGVGLNDEYIMNFAITPYFRWFFGGNRRTMQKAAAGFFIETNGSIFSPNYNNGNDYETSYTQDGENIYLGLEAEEDDLGMGLGLAIGWKYLTSNDWVGEIVFGGGRDFVNDGAYPRMGITIGKRF